MVRQQTDYSGLVRPRIVAWSVPMVGSVKKGTILLGMLPDMIGYILLAALPE